MGASTRPSAPYDLYLRLTRPMLGEIHSAGIGARPTEEQVPLASDGPAGVSLPLALVFNGAVSRWSAEAVPAWRSFANFEASVRSSFRLDPAVLGTYATWLVWARR